MALDDAVWQAVESCIEDGILRDFLLKHKAEVVQMSIFEYDEELHKKTLHEEGYEDGFVDGREEGQADLIRKMYNSGLPLEQIAEIAKMDVETIRAILET